MTMKPMQERGARRGQSWRRWRAGAEDALMRLRHGLASGRRPGWMSAPGRVMEGAWHGLHRRLHFVGVGLRGVRMRVGAVLHAVGRMLPRGAFAAGPSARVKQARVRWWDPIFVKMQPYLRTRQRAELVWGLPALVTVVGIVSVVAIVTGTRPAVTRNATLLRQAQMALSNKEYAKASITYERLLQVGGNDNDARFGLARCWAAMGENQQAAMLLNTLAPDGGSGYLPAHRVKAFLILESAAASMEDLEIAHGHLDRVLAADPDDAEAHGMLGTLFLKENKIREARDQFALSASVHPETALNAAMLSRQLGDKQAMMDFAAKAAAFNKVNVKGSGMGPGQVPAETALSLAQALCLQKKYGDAVETLEELLTRSDRDRLVKAILEICRVWEADVDRQAGAQDLERLRLVKTALTYDAASHDWQLRLLNLSGDGSVVRPVVVQLLQKLADDNAAGPEVCFFLGMEAFRVGDVAGARRLLERTLVLKPGHPATANNLACAYLTGREQDAAKALRYAEQALAAVPKNPMYHETRGEALLALQRWSEAAAEFEVAIPNLPARREAYQFLAVAYEKLGFVEKSRDVLRLAANDKSN